MVVTRFYQLPGLTPVELKRCERKLQGVLKKANFASDGFDVSIETQSCIYVDTQQSGLSANEEAALLWILKCPFGGKKVASESFITDKKVIEIGPRLNFSTAFSTNAVSICHSINLKDISRIEKSTHYLIKLFLNGKEHPTSPELHSKIVASLYDKMTEMVYITPVTSFDLHVTPEPVFEIDLLGEGKVALEKTSKKLGLSFDSWDIDFYSRLFLDNLKRNPTSVECFDLAQSNSEHCRHWYFKGKFFIDAQEQAKSLIDMVIDTQLDTNENNIIKFSDNSSAIKGFSVAQLLPEEVGKPSAFVLPPPSLTHIVFTAETHNFPTGVAPFQGATTGTGGRIRDVQATGRGARVVAGTAGYCVGCLNIPDYPLPWEPTPTYPPNLAHPLDILIEASNGASDYGNKFGEPILAGFCRSFGMLDVSGERREWVKPIMFTGGIGSMQDLHVNKLQPSIGMSVVKVGGPVLRIGVGGGSASSVSVQDDQRDELDFNAVQRGDAEMGEKMNRVIRACVERGANNPICSIHDQGAGGNGNVLKELCHPGGAQIRLSAFELADSSLSALEVWTAEYQESNALLVRQEHLQGLLQVAKRERCTVSVVGEITGDNVITFVDDRTSHVIKKSKKDDVISTSRPPIQLDLDLVLGKVPRKEYHVTRVASKDPSSHLPPSLTVQQALDRLLRLPSVASKRFLTSKVDRSVTGLVAQQQCVGPLHTPLADVAVVALSHFHTKGSATAIGEQPIKCLVDAACGARMAVVEALTNLVWASVGDIKDVKCSANWMWPAKLPGEDARLYDACVAMTTLLRQLGVGVDGGKDSLSMAAKVEGQVVKSPGNLVISTYAACDDITLTVTPDLKCPKGKGHLLHIPLSPGHHRLGGSALGQCFNCIGTTSPDLHDPQLFLSAFQAMQLLIKGRKIRSGHDVSDGGLLTCVLEMAFAGNCGLEADFKNEAPVIDFLFSEEAAYVVEVADDDVADVTKTFEQHHVTCHRIGHSVAGSDVRVRYNGQEVLVGETRQLRSTWEDTSFKLELLQSNSCTVEQEASGLLSRNGPSYKVSFNPDLPSLSRHSAPSSGVRVALLREEGSNGDREMAAALFMAGFTVHDVNMQDLISKSTSLDHFTGVVFVGGFSYADVLGSAKGWATAIRLNEELARQFEAFRERCNTFSLGVCNGCQLMSYLGWVATDVANKENSSEQGVMLERNVSERYESRFVSVRVQRSASMMLRGMHDSVLGVWVAHGEGRFRLRDDSIRRTLKDNNLIALTYADDHGIPTQEYPMNPNGSEDAIAAVCSHDGRHLAMMPHPERTVLRWQWPWIPEDQVWKASPWLRIFQNAHEWCLEHP